MKQIIIVLLTIIAILIGYGKYNQYKRYNTPEINYQTDTKVDINYYNQETVLNYHEAIEELNSYTKLQWTANSIDVRTPENDNEDTTESLATYAKKLAKVKYYETRLEKSALLKDKGLSNDLIKHLEKKGTDLKTYNEEIAREHKNKLIKNMFTTSKKIYYGQTSTLVHEVQKLLIKKGFDITADGIYKIATSNAIKTFEAKNNLFSDGLLDEITLDALLK
jgi:hypothetical protein